MALASTPTVTENRSDLVSLDSQRPSPGIRESDRVRNLSAFALCFLAREGEAAATTYQELGLAGPMVGPHDGGCHDALNLCWLSWTFISCCVSS